MCSYSTLTLSLHTVTHCLPLNHTHTHTHTFLPLLCADKRNQDLTLNDFMTTMGFTADDVPTLKFLK